MFFPFDPILFSSVQTPGYRAGADKPDQRNVRDSIDGMIAVRRQFYNGNES